MSQSWSQYGWSVTPSLMAWAALMMPGSTLGYLSVAAGHGLTCYFDLREGGYPSWLRGLRYLLTLIALMSLGIGMGCSLAFPDEDTALKKSEQDELENKPKDSQ